MSLGSGFQLLGVATTIPRANDGASSAMSDRPARKRWARSARAGTGQQALDEGVARGRGVDVPAGREPEVARRREAMGHGSYCVLAHDDVLRERLVGDDERVGIDRIEDHGARIGQDAEHRLDRVGADAQIVDDVARQTGRLERREIERHVRRGENLTVRLVQDRVAHRVDPVRVVVLLRDRRPRLERLGPEHEAEGNVCGRGESLRGPAEPAVRLDRPLHLGAVGARERSADELPDPRERQRGVEILRRDDEPGFDARDGIAVRRAQRDRHRVDAGALDVEAGRVARLVGILQPDRHDGVAGARARQVGNRDGDVVDDVSGIGARDRVGERGAGGDRGVHRHA